jgi:hypothetical protein
MKKYLIVLEHEDTKKQKVVEESGFDAEDVFAIIGLKYGDRYIIVSIKEIGELE